jgi:cytochrome c biogenesis protein CcdA
MPLALALVAGALASVNPCGFPLLPAFLSTEPWVFVTDAQGRLAAKYEGSVAPQELKALLRGL